MSFVYQGLRHYVGEAVGEMGLEPPDSVMPTSAALRSQSLRMIENQACGAQHIADLGDRSRVLSHIEGHLLALEVMFRAGVVMARDSYLAAGLAIPDWLEKFEVKVMGIGDMQEYIEMPDPDDDIFSLPLGPEECVLAGDEAVSPPAEDESKTRKAVKRGREGKT